MNTKGLKPMLTSKEKFEKLVTALQEAGDPEVAKGQTAYTRNQFQFFGMKAPERRKAYHSLIKADKKAKTIDWELLDKCYTKNYRELHYFVYDYLHQLEPYLIFEDCAHIKEVYLSNYQWWDSIDGFFKLFGKIGRRDERIKDLMLEWSTDPDFWIRRSAILHQINLKEETDTALLDKILRNNFGSDEFFINKAIGWALRDYSKIDNKWVRHFINMYRAELATLSIREGSKYL